MDRYELLGYYPACDAIAILSFYKLSMPNVMQEAGLLGIPLIASRTDGMKDLLAKENRAWLFNPGDLADASRAVKSWVDASPEELAQRTRRCQLHVRQYYNQEQETANYLEILTKTLRPT